MLAWMVSLAAILFPGSAHATSLYDDYYTSSPSVVLLKDGCPGPVDVSYTWDDYIRNSTYGNSLSAAMTNGSWGVSYLPHYGTSGTTVTATAAIVYWSESSTMAIDWTNWGYMVATGMSQAVLMELVNPGNGNPCSVSITSFGAGFISSNDGSVENYFFHGAISYPVDYEGPQVVSSQSGAKYVAMGDSFSSGEGNPPFEPGTDTSDNKCHRSSQAYPRLLQNDPDLNLGSMAFVACSGATTDSIVYGGNVVSSGGEDPQMSVLSSSTRIVTVTIGGNDVKFKEFASACVVTNCASSSSAYQESWDIMTNASNVDYLPNKLETAYDAIAESLTAANTAARVYVIGYPKVVTHDSWASTTSSDPWNCLYMSENSSSGAEAIVQKLNEVIHDAVEDFDDQRFVYVDPLATGSPFIGNELCRSGGYFYGASAAVGGSTSYVFHPNVNGQNAYKQIVADAIN